MSVEEAWRLLADTDHLNRTIGLPAVSFSSPGGAGGQFARTARARAFGLVQLTWTEYPFNWVRERGYRFRREFQRGPLAVVEGGIALEAAGEGVRVKAFADYTPANLSGRFLWRMGNATVVELLEFCDEYLARKQAGRADPTPVPAQRPSVNIPLLDRLIGRLRSHPVRQELVPLLRERVTEGTDDQVAGIRPFALAGTWGADRMEVLRLFLYATRVGIFELRWEVMCPNCRVPKVESAGLAQLPDRFHCDTCGIGYDVDFDQRVELRFTVHPRVRQAQDLVYCIGGPLRVPHVMAQLYLRPQEEQLLDLELAGPLRLRAVAGTGHLDLLPGPGRSRAAELKLTYADGRWSGPHSLRDPEREALIVPEGTRIGMRNQTSGPLLAVLEELEWTGEETTAAQVTALQEFRDLFSGEVLAPGQQMAIRDVALVFSDLKGSTSLYEGVGDAPAYSRVNRHFDFIREQVAAHRGTVVKTMGDAVMAAFHRMEDAAAAALDMQREIGSWCMAQEIRPPFVLKVGVHHGAVIAVNANGRLDYFGRTVNVAARVGAESKGGDVVILKEVFDEVSRLFEEARVEPFKTRLRGLEGERELVRIHLANNADPPSLRSPQRGEKA
jgi:class 3 adenylate cyclase